MRFKQLPSGLRLYILLQPVLLVPLLFEALRPIAGGDIGSLAALLFFTALFSTWKVELVVYQGRLTPVFAHSSYAWVRPGSGRLSRIATPASRAGENTTVTCPAR